MVRPVIAVAVSHLALSAGCAAVQRPPPPPAPPAALPDVPPGCAAPVEGTFAHEAIRDWEYTAQDDGRTLRLQVRRAPAGGTPGEAPVRIRLDRTPDGFAGHAEGAAFGGAQCNLAFPVRVLACDEHGLTLSSLVGLAVEQESCETAAPGADAAWVEHRLVRLPPPAVVPAEDAPPAG